MRRQTSGSVVCPGCGKLVGVQDETCWSCGRRNPGLWGYAPLLRQLGQDLGFAKATLTGCALLYLGSLLYDPGNIGMGGLFGLVSPSPQSLYAFGAAGVGPVLQEGRWWTLLSAGWLHGGLLHIGFNMYWLTYLAPSVAQIYGAGRMVIIYTAASVLGFLASSLAVFAPGIFAWVMGRGAGITVGASAAIFGLLGALVAYGRKGSSHVGRQSWFLAIFLFVFGLVMPAVDNWAHLGGFLGGYGMATILDPQKPERGDHLIAALVCLVATAAAVGASLWYGAPPWWLRG